MQLIEERAMGVVGVSSLAFEGTREAALLVGSQEASLHLLDMAPEGQVQSVSSVQHSTVSLRTLGGQVCLTGPRRHLLSWSSADAIEDTGQAALPVRSREAPAACGL